jgi:hypothetical protein
VRQPQNLKTPIVMAKTYTILASRLATIAHQSDVSIGWHCGQKALAR